MKLEDMIDEYLEEFRRTGKCGSVMISTAEFIPELARRLEAAQRCPKDIVSELAATKAALAESEGQIISGFYEDEVPHYSQGAPEHELQSVVTALEVQGLVQRIISNRERAEQAEAKLAESKARMAVMSEALQFYADGNHFDPPLVSGGHTNLIDSGTVAAKALANLPAAVTALMELEKAVGEALERQWMNSNSAVGFAYRALQSTREGKS